MKKHLLTLLFLTVSLTMSAAERPVAKMRQAAAQTLNAGKAKVTLSKPTLDIYNDGERFAIVSRDDRFPDRHDGPHGPDLEPALSGSAGPDRQQPGS